jgi:hypothetical protein
MIEMIFRFFDFLSPSGYPPEIYFLIFFPVVSLSPLCSCKFRRRASSIIIYSRRWGMGSGEEQAEASSSSSFLSTGK